MWVKYEQQAPPDYHNTVNAAPTTSNAFMPAKQSAPYSSTPFPRTLSRSATRLPMHAGFFRLCPTGPAAIRRRRRGPRGGSRRSSTPPEPRPPLAGPNVRRSRQGGGAARFPPGLLRPWGSPGAARFVRVVSLRSVQGRLGRPGVAGGFASPAAHQDFLSSISHVPTGTSMVSTTSAGRRPSRPTRFSDHRRKSRVRSPRGTLTCVWRIISPLYGPSPSGFCSLVITCCPHRHRGRTPPSASRESAPARNFLVRKRFCANTKCVGEDTTDVTPDMPGSPLVLGTCPTQGPFSVVLLNLPRWLSSLVRPAYTARHPPLPTTPPVGRCGENF